MGLMAAAQYQQSLNDGRVIYWGGEKITDITTHPRFKVPLDVACRDYAYDDPKLRSLLTYQTEDGDTAVNAPGVRISNRSFAPAALNEFDYPASAHHSPPGRTPTSSSACAYSP